MLYHIDSTGIDLHESQIFVIETGLTKLNRLCNHFPEDSVKANVHIHCHHKTPDSKPVFETSIHLEVPGKSMAATASVVKFNASYKNALNKILTQLRTHKAQLKGKKHFSDARDFKGQ